MKKYFFVAAMMVFVAALSFTALADGYYMEDGYVVIEGGRNSYNGEYYKDRRELEGLEYDLIMSGKYYQITPDICTIPDNIYKPFFDIGTYPFQDYINYTFSNVYLDKYLTDKIANEWATKGTYDTEDMIALLGSYVVIDYGVMDSKEKAFTYDTAIGDAIPEGVKAGYLKIITNIPVEITLLENDTKRYYQLFIGAGEETVKLKIGQYFVQDISFVEIADREETLPFENNIRLGDDYGLTKEEPYILDLTETIKKYGIKEVDLQTYRDILDHKATPNAHFEEPETKEEIPQAQTNGLKVILLFVGFMFFIGIGVATYCKVFKNNNGF